MKNPNRSSRQRLPGPRFLIMNGDDFGFTDGVSQGILTAWRERILTSTTAMINIEGAPERVDCAHRDNPTLPIGLHLNITYGRPVLPVERIASLVDGQGCFYPLLELVERLPLVSIEEVRLECFAQAERMASVIRFDHIDYHQGMPAAYGPFFPVVIELARQYHVPVRNPVPASTYGVFRFRGSKPLKAAAREVARLTARRPRLALALLPHISPAAFKRQAAELARQGILTTNWLIDAFHQSPSVETMVALIEQLPPGISELPVHPAVVDEALRQGGDPYVEGRAGELAVLLDPRVKEALRRCQVKLVDFSILSS